MAAVLPFGPSSNLPSFPLRLMLSLYPFGVLLFPICLSFYLSFSVGLSSSTSKIRNIFSLKRRMIKAAWPLSPPASVRRLPRSSHSVHSSPPVPPRYSSPLAIPFSPFFLYLSKVKNDPDAANYVKYLIRRISVIGIMADRYGIELPLYMAHSSCV